MFLFDFARTPNGVRDERAILRIIRIISCASDCSNYIVRIGSFESHHFPGCRCAPPRATEPSSPTGWLGIGADSRICNECGIGRPLGLPGLVAQMCTMREFARR